MQRLPIHAGNLIHDVQTLRRGSLALLQHPLPQKRHMGTTIGLTLEQLQPVDLALGNGVSPRVAPGQGQPRMNRGQVVLHALSKSS